MPQIRSAFKRLRQDKKKHIANKSMVSEIRTLTKKVRTLITEKDLKTGEQALRRLESKLDRAVKSNKMKKNTSSRKISRLRKQLSQIKK